MVALGNEAYIELDVQCSEIYCWAKQILHLGGVGVAEMMHSVVVVVFLFFFKGHSFNPFTGITAIWRSRYPSTQKEL